MWTAYAWKAHGRKVVAVVALLATLLMAGRGTTLLGGTTSMMAVSPAGTHALCETHRHSFTNLMAPVVFPQLYPECGRIVHPSLPRDPGLSIPSLSKSQHQEDINLYQAIFKGDDSPGVFLEIGALDGNTYSNTYAFEHALGWKGILVEANPANAANLRMANRPRSAAFSVAICGIGDDLLKVDSIEFTRDGGPVATAPEYAASQFLQDWSSDLGTERVRVPCIPLQYIIDATALLDIDFFSLDVEGSERLVLETVDLSRTNIRVLMVEMDGMNPDKDAWIRKHLLDHGFRRVAIDLPNPKNEVFENPRFGEVKRMRPGLPMHC